ncbi:MAG: hypothetical protein CM15mP129_06000 [Chloroflexota bacterium]|nr:MAG: hypothetical protein CM15mP129_06000 [Chloroflexota bacterium]
MEYFKVKNPENEFSLKSDSSLLFLRLIGLIEEIGEESIIHHILKIFVLGKYR